MDYQRIYDDLISLRQLHVARGYTEKHHIQMRSLGGSDDSSNIVKLTGREHYIAHLLLARFNRCSQTAMALWMMQCKSKDNDERPCIKSGRMYEWARKEFSKYISLNAKITAKGERNSQHGTCWICNLELKENRKISKTDELPQGWILGRNKWKLKTQEQKVLLRTRLAKSISINDGLCNRVLKYEDQLPIPIGWSVGKLFSSSHLNSVSTARRKTNFKLRGTSGQGGRHKRKAGLM